MFSVGDDVGEVAYGQIGIAVPRHVLSGRHCVEIYTSHIV